MARLSDFSLTWLLTFSKPSRYALHADLETDSKQSRYVLHANLATDSKQMHTKATRTDGLLQRSSTRTFTKNPTVFLMTLRVTLKEDQQLRLMQSKVKIFLCLPGKLLKRIAYISLPAHHALSWQAGWKLSRQLRQNKIVLALGKYL